MAVRINFDNLHNPLQPVLVLANKGGNRLGAIPSSSLVVKDSMTDGSELTFFVHEKDCKKNGLAKWNDITDFKTIWAKEWNRLYEIRVEIDEKDSTSKTVSAKSLGEAELSQILLNNVEINTEDDILRDDYVPSVLYNPNNPNGSILNRVFAKAPHYRIRHVDDSIANLQRSFSFDDKDIYSATKEIGKEIECIFIFECYYDEYGSVKRDIDVFDLKDYCLECGERGSFNGVCDKCGSNLIKHGYGEDTGIFVSTANLADSIQYSTDVDSVKNCFRLEAGDELMTATIANCNPNGTEYIWYIPDEIKGDMSSELVGKLDSYDDLYSFYQNEYELNIDQEILDEYNSLIEKYNAYTNVYKKLPQSIVGYPAIMQAYYDTIDFKLFLSHDLMPSPGLPDTNANTESQKLNYAYTVAVKNIGSISQTTADSFVSAFAKSIIDPRYRVSISESSYVSNSWSGKFTVTNYSNEDDTATTNRITYTINDDYALYVKQLLDKSLKRDEGNEKKSGIAELFSLQGDAFAAEIKKYALSSLKIFYDSCISCLNIMAEQGVSNAKSLANDNVAIYEDLYVSYYNKSIYLQSEISVREHEISVIGGTYDSDGVLESDGIQTVINNARENIKKNLNFENYLGESLLKEFSSYRRDDKYSNSNYISDGLNNAEIFSNAMQFIEVAKEEIFKSANLQHSIKAALKNLLAIKEFSSIVDSFEIGNWIRVLIDKQVYKLRLVNYEISFDNKNAMSVDFSDVLKTKNGYSDVANIIEEASNMASSYDYVSRQAKKGSEGNGILTNWVNNGLELTQTRIINDADNQNVEFDKHGLTCKRYIPELDAYDDRQLKLINSGLYLTDDAWKSSRAGIGNFVYYNPATKQYEDGYGVIADTIIGNLILSKEVGVYNTSNSIVMDENGFVLTADMVNDAETQKNFSIQRIVTDADGSEKVEQLMFLDTDGNLVLNGSILINATSDMSGATTLYDAINPENLLSMMQEEVKKGTDQVLNSVDEKYNDVISDVEYRLDEYKAEIGQYMQFNDEGFTIGAQGEAFRTVIDNTGMYFKEGDSTVSYIANNQLYINDAVINSSLTLGKFFFLPRADGGVSLTWHG